MNKAVIIIGIVFLVTAVPLMFYSIDMRDYSEDSFQTPYGYRYIAQYNGWFVIIGDPTIPMIIYPYRLSGISVVISAAAIMIIGFFVPPRKPLQKN